MFGELEDILDEIVPDSSDCIIHDEEFMDTVLQLMEEYISENIEELMEEDFHESFINEIFEIVLTTFGGEIQFTIMLSVNKELRTPQIYFTKLLCLLVHMRPPLFYKKELGSRNYPTIK